MLLWPESLPQKLELAGVSYAFPQTGLRTTVDAGPGFQRPMQTGARDAIGGQMTLTTVQLHTLRLFFEEQTYGGTQPFLWQHPLRETGAVTRFLADQPPEVSPLSGE